MSRSVVERARRYLASLPVAISGSGGRAATFKVALVLIKGFGLSEEEALALIMEWNAGCSPPWSERELRAVLRDAAKSDKPHGYLLKDRAATVDEAEIRRQKRWTWNAAAMRAPIVPELKLVAALRNVSPQAADLLRCQGHLWRGRWRDQDAFFIRNGPNGTFCQARRMDGEPFDFDGRRIKSLNLPGAEGKFLCPGGLGGAESTVILIEGAIGLLEAAEFVLRAETQESVLKPRAIMAAVSAAVRFSDTQLVKLAGRNVLILADPDDAGREAAAAWCGQLKAAGCGVRSILPPAGFRDFGGLLKTTPVTDPVWSRITTFA